MEGLSATWMNIGFRVEDRVLLVQILFTGLLLLDTREMILWVLMWMLFMRKGGMGHWMFG